jgi:arylsulfatase
MVDVYVYVMDALRPDFLGCYGDMQAESPHIDQLASDALTFENAYAAATWTKPSGAAILCGEYPRAVNMNHTFNILDTSVDLLPQLLQQRGYRTLGVTGQGFISDRFGLGDGYDEYINMRTKPNANTSRSSSGMTSDEALSLPDSIDLNQAICPLISNSESDVFSLIWSVDTHDPYFVPGEESHFGNTGREYVTTADFDRFIAEHGVGRMMSLYRDMIRYNDAALGDFITHLKDENRYEDSVIIVTADHGEAFGEHGNIGHAGIVYEEEVRVPLILKLPHERMAGSRIEAPVSLVDILPTIGDVLDMSIDKPVDGHSLIQTANHGSRDGVIFCETYPNPGFSHSAATRGTRYKRICVDYPDILASSSFREALKNLRSVRQKFVWRTDRIFDLEHDSSEKEPLNVRAEPESVSAGRSELLQSLDGRSKNRVEANWNPSSQQDNQVQERLRNLGYIE